MSGLSRIASEYRTIDDVVAGLTDVEAYCLGRADLRGVFATAYLHITRAIERAINDGAFSDPDWTRRYLVQFGELYRRALFAYEEGRSGDVPRSWRIAFDAARDQRGFVIQHLTLGINAHINHDLPFALDAIGIDPERQAKYADHALVNLILAEATNGMKQVVCETYAPILLRLDRVAGRYAEDLPNFSIPKAREHAWAMAVALAACRSAAERRTIAVAIDEQAAVLARLILASPTQHPTVVQVVERAKRVDALMTRIERIPGIGRLFRR